MGVLRAVKMIMQAEEVNNLLPCLTSIWTNMSDHSLRPQMTS